MTPQETLKFVISVVEEYLDQANWELTLEFGIADGASDDAIAYR